jgi:pilus assembly protein CpaC
LGYPGSVDLGSASASFDFLTQSFQSATAVVEDQALLRLDMAQTSGWAKLMRKAAVIAENGQRAEFSGGGEVNIPVQGSLTTGIHTISFGSTIEILPRYDAVTGRLEIELVADVSDLTDDRGSGAPGRVTSSIATVVNLKVGQALVLAGLTSETKLKSNTGVPLLSQIPILGLLFGSERMVEQTADNVIFIVPTVVDATSTDARRQVNAALDAFKDYRGKSKERETLRSTWGSK